MTPKSVTEAAVKAVDDLHARVGPGFNADNGQELFIAGYDLAKSGFDPMRRFNHDRCQEMVAEGDKRIEVLEAALRASGCETIQNHEGSGMFNKHDPACRKCQALAAKGKI